MCVFVEKIIVLSALLFRVFVGLSWEKYFIIRTIVSNICMAFLRKLLYYPNCCYDKKTICIVLCIWGFLEKTIVLSELLLRVFVGFLEKNAILFDLSELCFLRKLLYYPNCFYEYLWGFPKKTIVLSELLFQIFVRLSWENYCIIRTVFAGICEALLRKLFYYPNFVYLWGFLEKTIVLSELLWRLFVRLSWENYCIIRTTVTIMCKAFLRKLLYYPNCCGDYL